MLGRQTFDCAQNEERDCISCRHGEDSGRAAEATEGHPDCRIGIIMAEIGTVVNMSRFIMAAVHVDMASEIVVQVNRPS
jgi:hypothetical protein